MPALNRKNAQRDEQHMREALADVFQATTREERMAQALNWTSGNFDAVDRFADSRRLMPMALTIASLDEAEHPIIQEARTYAALGALIITAELRRGRIVRGDVDNRVIVHISAEQEAARY